MPRSIWKGAISFGLVHVPVALYPASQDSDIDFDWLDKRTMDPVGYKRVNKRTGREIERDDIVKGVKQENGEYVVLSEEEVRAAYPKTTQTIDIESFVRADEISLIFFERPYFLEPSGRGEKVYALLRESMLDSGLIGIARIVLHTKQHLAALVPIGSVLMLATMRWANEIRSVDELKIPTAGKSAIKLTDGELKMAGQLIKEMTATWRPADFQDDFSNALRELIARKVKAGDTETVEPIESPVDGAPGAKVIDLVELLKKSLKRPERGAARATERDTAAPPERSGKVVRSLAAARRKRAAGTAVASSQSSKRAKRV